MGEFDINFRMELFPKQLYLLPTLEEYNTTSQKSTIL